MKMNTELLGVNVYHDLLGEGVIKNTKWSGSELLVEFKNGLKSWILKDNIKILGIGERLEKCKEVKPIKREFDPKFAKCIRMEEAFRLGVVPEDDIEDFIFGREKEIEKINKGLKKSAQNGGHLVAIEAEYGGGKTHFLSYLYHNLIRRGYAVGKSKVNLSHIRPYIPKDIYHEIVTSLKYVKDGKIHTFRDLLLEIAKSDYQTDHFFFAPALELLRLNKLKNESLYEYFWRWLEGENLPRWFINEIRFFHVPMLYNFSTAVDNYCYLLSGISNMLKYLGIKGFVILIDEAENFFHPKLGPEKQIKCEHVVRGLIHLSIKKGNPTMHTKLKSTPYLYKDSRVMLVMAFTNADVNFNEKIELTKFTKKHFLEVFNTITKIYLTTRPDMVLSDEKKRAIFEHLYTRASEGIRFFIKASLYSLDLIRQYPDMPIEKVLAFG
jgi:hypothetical protein